MVREDRIPFRTHHKYTRLLLLRDTKDLFRRRARQNLIMNLVGYESIMWNQPSHLFRSMIPATHP
jgi:hypothetical protein